MRQSVSWQVVIVLFIPYWAAGQDTAEELPPPAAKSVLATKPPRADEAPVATEGDSPAWGLVGISARHYFIGSMAIADYLRGGQRHIVSLVEEDPATHARLDPHYAYYREGAAGHRWAISRKAGLDQSYSIYFQAADAPGAWTLLQRARTSWDVRPAFALPQAALIVEPSCGD